MHSDCSINKPRVKADLTYIDTSEKLMISRWTMVAKNVTDIAIGQLKNAIAIGPSRRPWLPGGDP